MTTSTRVHRIAITLKVIAAGWIFSCFFCFIPDGWMNTFLGWFGAEPMPPGIFMRYCLDGGGLIIGGVGVVIWVVATDVVRYHPIAIAIIALHLLAAPVFYVMDTIVGMPLWWRVMDFGSFLVGSGFLLAFWFWPSKPANPQGGANGKQPFSSETHRTSAAAGSRGSR